MVKSCFPIYLVSLSDIKAIESIQRQATITSFATKFGIWCDQMLVLCDDAVLENMEPFFVTLDRTPALNTRITLNPVDGDIDILDNDSEIEWLFISMYD